MSVPGDDGAMEEGSNYTFRLLVAQLAGLFPTFGTPGDGRGIHRRNRWRELARQCCTRWSVTSPHWHICERCHVRASAVRIRDSPG
jgi:hypothetical protein